MPVEIRELVIRVVTTSEAEDRSPATETNQRPVDMEAIVQECIRQIMSILKKKEER